MAQLTTFIPATASEEEWNGFLTYFHASSGLEDPYAPVMPRRLSDPSIRGSLATKLAARYWLMSDDDRVIAAAYAHPLPSGTVRAGGSVLAEWRGRGIGSALLNRIRDCAREEGLRDVHLVAYTAPGEQFLKRRGLAELESWIFSRLSRNRIDWQQLASITEESERRLAGLTMTVHDPALPPERLDEVSRFAGTLMTEALSRGAEMNPDATATRLRQAYQVSRQTGDSQHCCALATERSGELVGLCNCACGTGPAATRAWFILTGVREDWRGRGLARYLKATVLRRLHSRRPAVEVFLTSNAQSNLAVLRTNQSLGFTPYRRSVVFRVADQS